MASPIVVFSLFYSFFPLSKTLRLQVLRSRTSAICRSGHRISSAWTRIEVPNHTQSDHEGADVARHHTEATTRASSPATAFFVRIATNKTTVKRFIHTKGVFSRCIVSSSIDQITIGQFSPGS